MERLQGWPVEYWTKTTAKVTVKDRAAYEGIKPNKPNFGTGNLRVTLPRESNNKRRDIEKQSKNVRNKNNAAMENQERKENSNPNSITAWVFISPINPPYHHTANGKSRRKNIAKKLMIIANEFT